MIFNKYNQKNENYWIIIEKANKQKLTHTWIYVDDLPNINIIFIYHQYTRNFSTPSLYIIYIYTLKVFCNMIQSTTKWKHFLMKNNKKYTNKISTSLKFNNIFLNNKSICSHKNNSNRLFKICNKTRYFSAASAAVDVK